MVLIGFYCRNVHFPEFSCFGMLHCSGINVMSFKQIDFSAGKSRSVFSKDNEIEPKYFK